MTSASLARRIAAFVLLALLRPGDAVPLHAQQDDGAAALRSCQRILKQHPFARAEDSIARIAFREIVPTFRWRSQELWLLGVAIGEKQSASFLGPFLRGLYLSAISTDRHGHERARRELAQAWQSWPRDRYVPQHGSLDAMRAAMMRAGRPYHEQQFAYDVTQAYLQLNYTLSQEHLELNEASDAYQTIRLLLDEDFAVDFYSLNKLSWMYYKYRYFRRSADYPFLKNTIRDNVQAALDCSFATQRKVDAYLSAKRATPEAWADEYTIRWYYDATTNLLSIEYGVLWQTDSAIVYYEKMPDYMKLRNNGQILYLSDLNYRAAEYQFEMIGFAGGRPLEVVSEPGAILQYKTQLICKGRPELAYDFLDNYTRKYHEQRGLGMIALGTVNYWCGHLDEASRTLGQAAEYPEVFGYTSLTRAHYDAQLRTVQGAVYEARAHALDFEAPVSEGFFARLWERIVRFFVKLYCRFMAFLSLHRATDIYLHFDDRGEFLKPWYSENPLDYHALWLVLRRLDPDWHLARLKEARASDTRPRAGRYYAFLEAGFLHARGDNAAARRLLEGNGQPLWDAIDTSYEKLLGVMALDLDIDVRDALDAGGERARIIEMYRRYPQTVQLWGHRLPLRFSDADITRGALSEEQRRDSDRALETLRDFDFDFVEDDASVPVLEVNVRREGAMLVYHYRVTVRGEAISSGSIPSERKQDGALRPLPPREIARELAYGVFRISAREVEH